MKDPAVLFYTAKWIEATQGFKGAARGWYLDLLLYQYDHGSIPDDFDTMAGICRVQPSEINLFKQTLEQKLNKKFNKNEQGELENAFASEVLSNREKFKEKRSDAGKMSYLVRFAKNHFDADKDKIQYLKNNLDLKQFNENNIKDATFVQNVLGTLFELYISVNVNKDISNNVNKNELEKRQNDFFDEVNKFSKTYPDLMLDEFADYWTELNKSKTLMRFELEKTFEISKRLVTWSKRSKEFSNEKARYTYDEMVELITSGKAKQEDFEMIKDKDGTKYWIKKPKKK